MCKATALAERQFHTEFGGKTESELKTGPDEPVQKFTLLKGWIITA